MSNSIKMKASDINSEATVSTSENFKRSFSLPLHRIKSRKDGYVGVKVHANGSNPSNKADSPTNSDNVSSNHVSRFKRGFFSTRSMRGHIGRKKDIRISRFDVSDVPISKDVKEQVKKAEQHRTNNGVILHNISPHLYHGTETILEEPSENATTVGETKRWKQLKNPKKVRRNSKSTLVRVLGASLKRMRIPEKNQCNGKVLKTVEIKRESNVTLGIYIKQVKRIIKNGRHQTSLTIEKSPRLCVIISRLVPGSAAAKQGILKPGDEIVSINDVDIDNMDLKMVAAIMDLPKVLLLVVRSSGTDFGLNNNVDSNTLLENRDSFKKIESIRTDENIIPSLYDNNNPNININSQHLKENSNIKPKIEIEYDEAYQILQNAINDLEHATSNSYTNNDIISSKNDQGTLLNSNTNNSRPSSYWDILNDWIRPSEIGKSRQNSTCSSTGFAEELNWEESILHQLPHFPTASIHSNSHVEDPDYDEVAGSVFDDCISQGEELEVDGCSKHLSRSANNFLTSSSDSISSNASTGLSASYAIHCNPNIKHGKTTTKKKSKSVFKLKKSFSMEPHSEVISEMPSTSLRSATSDNGVKTGDFRIVYPDKKSSEEINFTSLSRANSGVTVAKRQEWYNKGANVSKELKERLEGGLGHIPAKPALRSENDNKSSEEIHLGLIDSAKITTVADDDKLRTSSESSSNSSNSNSVKTSNHIINKKVNYGSHLPVISSPIPVITKTSVSSSGGDDVEEHEKPIIPVIQNSNQLYNAPTPLTKMKNIFTSPPRTRKMKFGRKFRKTKKRGSSDGSSPDQISPPCCVKPTGTLDSSGRPVYSLNPANNNNTVIEKLNLDIGQSHQRRISRQFLLDHKNNHHPFAKALSMSEFKKYKPQNEAKVDSSSTAPIQGSLVITLYGARDMKKTVSEVYCVAQVDDAVANRIRTSMSPCRVSVAWNECFEAKLEEAYNLHLTLYSWEKKGSHKVLAKATVPIAHLLSKKKQGEPQRLAIKLDPRGTLYVKLSLEDPASLAGPSVFGADLQSILDREDTSLRVPLIVDKCISEVESRGMQVVGIYRLCGSAIMKKDLRRKFEEDAASVDLSPDKYPDVNVITGILKDFLRELPQPLFPPELLEAVTASMESTGSAGVAQVSSPFDPTPGVDSKVPERNTNNSTDVLTLLEDTQKLHLPIAERATLYALLNHLKKVAANQSCNKMTCQNLAVCFGPVLLGSVHMGQAKNSLDLAAAIGFKRHIQVLNFMVSNWPEEPVSLARASIEPEYDTIPFETASNFGDPMASRRTSRVSLTRRISHIFPSISAGSSGNLLDVQEGDNDVKRSLAGSKYSLLERSSSLTSIDETHADMEMTIAHPTEEFMEPDVDDLMFSGEVIEEEDVKKENLENTTMSFLKFGDDGRVILDI